MINRPERIPESAVHINARHHVMEHPIHDRDKHAESLLYHLPSGSGCMVHTLSFTVKPVDCPNQILRSQRQAQSDILLCRDLPVQFYVFQE